MSTVLILSTRFWIVSQTVSICCSLSVCTVLWVDISWVSCLCAEWSHSELPIGCSRPVPWNKGTPLYLYPEVKFNYCAGATAKCSAADGMNPVVHGPLQGTRNINLEWKTKVRTHDYSNSVVSPILPSPLLTTLWSRRSSSSETELLNCDANEHICWQRLRSSNNAASRFKASAVLVRKLSKWMILLQRKVTWKIKARVRKIIPIKLSVIQTAFVPCPQKGEF